MAVNKNAINFDAKSVSGVHYRAVILPGFAKLADNGLILSFTLPPSPAAKLGHFFFLDDSNRRTEERTRKIAGTLADAGLNVAANEIYHRKTGMRFNWQATTVVKALNDGVVSWLNAHIPRISDAHFAYYDGRGKLAFRDLFYVR